MPAGSPAPDGQTSTVRMPKIGFVGSMNAMPMGYALKFVRDGFDVKYVVEAEKTNFLMRPEHQYSKDVSYPYPEWVVEHTRSYSLAGHAFAPLTYRAVAAELADRDVIFLNDYGLSIASSMPKNALLIALSSGSDIDVLCSYEGTLSLAASIRRKWLFPVACLLQLIRTFRQRSGLAMCKVVVYFPEGLNSTGDRIIRSVAGRNPKVQVIRRFDVNFSSTGIMYQPVKEGAIKKILVPVRFNIRPPSGSEFEYKGNDKIIRALGRYRERNSDIEVHFFEKGPPEDIRLAKLLCDEVGLSANVIWHSQMPLSQLLNHYYDCDVCIDQVGHHWMGAVGFYALFAGRPLIANGRPDVFEGLWGRDTPVLQATTPEEIFAHLVACEDFSFRRSLSERSHQFACEKLDTENVYRRLKKIILASNQ